jgi:GT2 family glycosyltransferase
VNRGERPSVDVAVVTWNTAELTVTALRRLLDTDQGCVLRLLVRDNASSDGTVERLSRAVPEAEIDAGVDNLGFAAGVNRLLARSNAPWVFVLNSDAWPEPGTIGRLLEVAERHPNAAIIAPRIERPDGTLEHSTYSFPSVRLAWRLATKGRSIPPRLGDELMLEGAWNHDRERAVDWAVGAALLMRRDAIQDVGGFDERFFMYTEDVEWCWRARKRGWEVVFSPAAVVRHVGNASGAQNYGVGRTKAYLRNTYRFFGREHGPVASLAYRAGNLLGCLRLYRRAKRDGDPQRALFWREHVIAALTPATGADGAPGAARSRG